MIKECYQIIPANHLNKRKKILVKKVILILSIIASISGNATSAGEVTWTEMNGMKWSSTLEGTFQNLDLDNVRPIPDPYSRFWIVQKTEASEACSSLGQNSVLPTKADLEALGEGIKKLDLPDKAIKYWLSSVSSIGIFEPFEFALAYDGSMGLTEVEPDNKYFGLAHGFRHWRAKVRCVRK